jgi:Glycosyl hydrolases family 25
VPDGVDVAKYQGRIDWATAGPLLTFASAKASQGVTEVDATFARNWQGMRAAGVPLRFANHLPSTAPIAEQLAQMDRALEGAGVSELVAGAEGVALDIEPDPAAGIASLAPSFAVDLAAAFAEHYKRPAVAAYIGYFEPAWRPLVAAGHAWWLPWPFPGLGVDGTGRRWFGAETITLVSAWQYGQGTVPGIPATVDLDRILSLSNIERLTSSTIVPEEIVTPDDINAIVAALTPVIHDQCFDAVADIMHDPGQELFNTIEARCLAACTQALEALPPAPGPALVPHVHPLDVSTNTGEPIAG